MSPTSPTRYNLEILADADPVLLIRLVERIQSGRMTPFHLNVAWLPDDRCFIVLAFLGVDESELQVLARRVEQFTTVHSVHCRPLAVRRL